MLCNRSGGFKLGLDFPGQTFLREVVEWIKACCPTTLSLNWVLVFPDR